MEQEQEKNQKEEEKPNQEEEEFDEEDEEEKDKSKNDQIIENKEPQKNEENKIEEIKTLEKKDENINPTDQELEESSSSYILKYVRKSNEPRESAYDKELIHKQIVQNENESKLLDKQKERMKLDENIIKETKNQIQYKINEQKLLNKRNKSENDLQLLYYETVIKQKSMFMEFSDERKARQIKIEQQAKIDSHDKQEVDKRRKCHQTRINK